MPDSVSLWINVVLTGVGGGGGGRGGGFITIHVIGYFFFFKTVLFGAVLKNAV